MEGDLARSGRGPLPGLPHHFRGADGPPPGPSADRLLGPPLPGAAQGNYQGNGMAAGGLYRGSAGENFKMISFYYSEYDGTTRGTSQYFISFWKDNKEYFTCTGSNLLNIYNPVITVSNNIINIKAYKVYKPLSIYYYSFIYKRPNIFFHSVMEISTDGDNNTEIKYHYSSSDSPVNINSIYADKLIKK